MTITLTRTETGTATHGYWEVKPYCTSNNTNGWSVTPQSGDTGATFNADLIIGAGPDTDDEITLDYFNSGGDHYTTNVTVP